MYKVQATGLNVANDNQKLIMSLIGFDYFQKIEGFDTLDTEIKAHLKGPSNVGLQVPYGVGP